MTTTNSSTEAAPPPPAPAAAAEKAKSRYGPFNNDLELSIIGIGAEYPPFFHDPDALGVLAERYYPKSEAMTKVLRINQFTGIDRRSAIGPIDHPLVNQPQAPTIQDLCQIFLTDGVALAVTAARKAIAEAGINISQITHVVSTTCTNSANPGYDHYVCKALGITHPVEKVLLHGIGCSGGLAALRTAANLALGASFRGKSARILVMALELSSTMVRSELDSIDELQEVRIGAALFSDCASCVVLSNGIGGDEEEEEEAVYELLGWEHGVIPDTEKDLGFDVHTQGWKVVLSPRVPKLTQSILQPTFSSLLSSLPHLPPSCHHPQNLDWALHPGGSTILQGVEAAMHISAEHMRASYDRYINHGNSSSATIFSVLDRLREKEMDGLAPGGEVKEHVVGCAFGPGITIEMCMLRRNLGYSGRRRRGGGMGEVGGLGVGGAVGVGVGEMTPPETESEGSRSDVEGEGDGELEAEREVEMNGGVRMGEGPLKTEEEPDSLKAALNGVDLD